MTAGGWWRALATDAQCAVLGHRHRTIVDSILFPVSTGSVLRISHVNETAPIMYGDIPYAHASHIHLLMTR